MKFFNKIIVFPIFIIFSFSYVFAAGGKISGKIVEKFTGNPMPGVNIIIVGTDMGAATDLNGEYFILNIPPGTYEVKASIIGYKTITQTNVDVSINHTTELDFEMEETVYELDESIVVTSERPLIEKDLTSSRHFVSSEEISVRPTTQLNDVLKTLPGIDADAQGQLTVRRGSLDQVAFLIDGIRASNPLNYQPYTNINLSSIQELEIITGAFNAEYGQAQSGVFNIITKEGSSNFSGYAEIRYIPAYKPHWGTALYDYSTTRYWENTHARHLQWWIDNPDQWVDPNGTPGNDPYSIYTPEEAYQNYIDTHQPLTNYTNESGYQTEVALGGPLPITDLYFFATGKYRNVPPVTGNSFRDRGSWADGTVKITYKLNPQMKFMLSGFYSEANTNIGMEYFNSEFVSAYTLSSKYSFHDFYGYPKARNDGQILQFTHVLGQNTFYVLQVSRNFRYQSQSTFPGDEDGWETGGPINDNLRAVDEFGNPIPGGYSNIIGLHADGYYYRGKDENTEFTLSGDVTSQLNNSLQIKGGGDLSYYNLDRFQETKSFEAIERETYHPYEGNIYLQTKLEFEGLIINAGFRYDFYNPNDKKYLDLFDPLGVVDLDPGEQPNPKTEPTSTFSQFSPRIGVSHPISENTVLHFSYGHFFQRANFGDYGEGLEVSGILNTYLTDPAVGFSVPYGLGNRDLKPRKTIAYELGIEHNISGLVADVTAFYKDITQTVRTITIRYLGGYYRTSGNGDYGDSKGIEISIRKPLSNYWGGYLNYTYTTGIEGRSGDPRVISAPGVPNPGGAQGGLLTGDAIVYDRPRLKFGITLSTPSDFNFLHAIFSDMQFAIDYQIYYPNENISSDVFSEAGRSYLRAADKNADVRIRKELNLGFIRPSLFVEIKNVFNYKWTNLDIIETASQEDRVKFINSGFENFPEKQNDGAPFPDQLNYNNLPRQIIFGISFSY
jgi:outer membrane receptor protein involved in Fe transport